MRDKKREWLVIVATRRHFVGLDGLKGIALIAIVLYHCDEGALHGGFFGVDVFFTISGFLIFSSLLNHIDSVEASDWGSIISSASVESIPRSLC